MTPILAVALGGGLGGGLWLLTLWARPPRPPLGRVLAATEPAPAQPLLTAPAATSWVARWGRPLVAPLHAAGLPGPRMADDLRVIGRDVADHLAVKGTLALLGLLTPVALELLATLAGSGFGLAAPVAVGLAGAAIGFTAPDLAVRRAAAARRAEARHALSAYLDLVVISLAGGAGIDSALHSAVRVGHGWAFQRLTLALDTAALTRTTPWARLRQLGNELGVAELAELAASASLAGTEGAKVRASLATKAAALRTREANEVETAAQATTERMALPVTALFGGFLTFIGYPALAAILGAL